MANLHPEELKHNEEMLQQIEQHKLYNKSFIDAKEYSESLPRNDAYEFLTTYRRLRVVDEEATKEIGVPYPTFDIEHRVRVNGRVYDVTYKKLSERDVEELEKAITNLAQQAGTAVDNKPDPPKVYKGITNKLILDYHGKHPLLNGVKLAKKILEKWIVNKEDGRTEHTYKTLGGIIRDYASKHDWFPTTKKRSKNIVKA